MMVERIRRMLKERHIAFCVERDHIPDKILLPAIGVTNVVHHYDNIDNITGYLCFWEFDELKPYFFETYHDVLTEAVIKFNVDFTVFETKNGVHIVSFSVTDKQTRKNFESYMSYYYPNDEWEIHTNRILRITNKHCEYAPKYVCHFQSMTLDTPRSLDHILTYRKIIPIYLLQLLLRYAKPTQARHLLIFSGTSQPEDYYPLFEG